MTVPKATIDAIQERHSMTPPDPIVGVEELSNYADQAHMDVLTLLIALEEVTVERDALLENDEVLHAKH